jgi:hypothetical protein
MFIISHRSSRAVRVNRKSRTPHKPPASGVLGASIVLSPAELTVVRRQARAASEEPKFAIGVRVVANDHAPTSYRGRVGSVSGIGPGKSEYRINYGDDRTPEHAQLMSWCLALKH